jgi:hypothetical protein
MKLNKRQLVKVAKLTDIVVEKIGTYCGEQSRRKKDMLAADMRNLVRDDISYFMYGV